MYQSKTVSVRLERVPASDLQVGDEIALGSRWRIITGLSMYGDLLELRFEHDAIKWFKPDRIVLRIAEKIVS
jgi:hypothetical protein